MTSFFNVSIAASPRLRARCRTRGERHQQLGDDQDDGGPRKTRNQQLAAARRRWPISAAEACAAGRKERGQSTHQRFAVNQGLVQVLEAAVTGLEPGKPYLLALPTEPSGSGVLEPLQGFMTNPAGAAIVNAIGPIRQVMRGEDKIPRRYLVIVPGTPDHHGVPVQVQSE
jgi:hypothetical protein